MGTVQQVGMEKEPDALRPDLRLLDLHIHHLPWLKRGDRLLVEVVGGTPIGEGASFGLFQPDGIDTKIDLGFCPGLTELLMEMHHRDQGVKRGHPIMVVHLLNGI